MDKDKLREVIRDSLRKIDCYSPDAENLLLETCAVESALGKYREQMGGGPALGIFQMEKATFVDICDNYLRYKKELARKIAALTSGTDTLRDSFHELKWNDAFAAAMARAHYRRFPEPIPATVLGRARMWKKRYNTYLGKGTVEKYMMAHERYIRQ